MLVSTCGTIKSPKWHTVHWINPSHKHQWQAFTDTFCSAIKESQKSKTRLRIQLRGDGSWNKTAAQHIDRVKQCAAPNVTLEKWLATRNRDPSRAAPSKKEILRLALTIAKSLLYLFGSPLLQGPWRSETIYVVETTDSPSDVGLRVKPYIPAQLTTSLELEEFEQTEKGKSSILHLGLLLWELFFGKKVTVTEEDIEDDEDDETESLYNALNREQIGSETSVFVDPSCLAIIGNCLDLYGEAKTINPAFLTKMYWKVIKPLRTSLESYDLSWQVPVASVETEVTLPHSNHVPSSFQPSSSKYSFIPRISLACI